MYKCCCFQVSDFDVSWNKNLGTKSVGYVGQITKNCNVSKLSMEGCDLKHEELDSFMKHSDGAKVRNLYLRVFVCLKS